MSNINYSRVLRAATKISFNDGTLCPIQVLKVNDSPARYILKDDQGCIYSNNKGKLVTSSTRTEWLTLNLALTRVRAITNYFVRKLTEKELQDYLVWMITDEDTQAQEFYTKLINLIGAKQYQKAYTLYRAQDTFVRDGVPSRVLNEIIKNRK